MLLRNFEYPKAHATLRVLRSFVCLDNAVFAGLRLMLRLSFAYDCGVVSVLVVCVVVWYG